MFVFLPHSFLVLRIYEILVWIRIRIRGSISLTNGPDPDPAIFVSDLIFLLITVPTLLLIEGTFTSFFKENKS
jgi:hypothetical protein